MGPPVDRRSKPNPTGRDYVNLRPAARSLTVRENPRERPHGGGNVQRTKSAACDYQSDAGYLFMESPKRTDSTTRYSKKEFKDSIPEEDIVYEFMCKQDNRDDVDCPDYEILEQLPPRKETSPEKSSPVSSTLFVSSMSRVKVHIF